MIRKQEAELKPFMNSRNVNRISFTDTMVNKTEMILPFIKMGLVKIDIEFNCITSVKLNLINYFKWIKEDE